MQHVTPFLQMEPRILFQRQDALGTCTLLSLTVAPFGAGLAAHCDRHRTEWHVIRGVLALSVGHHTITLCRGQSAEIAAELVHSCWNPGPEPVDVLVVAHGERQRAIGGAVS